MLSWGTTRYKLLSWYDSYSSLVRSRWNNISRHLIPHNTVLPRNLIFFYSYPLSHTLSAYLLWHCKYLEMGFRIIILLSIVHNYRCTTNSYIISCWKVDTKIIYFFKLTVDCYPKILNPCHYATMQIIKATVQYCIIFVTDAYCLYYTALNIIMILCNTNNMINNNMINYCIDVLQTKRRLSSKYHFQKFGPITPSKSQNGQNMYPKFL